MHEDWPVLLVDDEKSVLLACEVVLRRGGVGATERCEDSRHVMERVAGRTYGAVLLDLTMPHITGGELLERLGAAFPELPVIVLTGANEVETAVECMKKGAFDYMVKPVEDARLVSGVRRALELRQLRRENAQLAAKVKGGGLENPEAFSRFRTASAAMYATFRYLETAARTSKPVLITGETGTGKELIARSVHEASGRPGQWVAVNVAGLDDNMFSDTLFGHVKGAYTGASEARPGMVEQAANGTLFLDEIGDLAPASQVKLLRLLQEGEYTPLGADAPQHTNARVVVATRRDLEQLQRDGRFRPDLYYRLRRHHVHVLPLRERLDDLPLLLDHFLHHAAEVLGKRKPSPPDGLLPLLSTHRFPGNVRELESMVFDAVSRHRGRRLSLQSFRELLREGRAAVVQCADTEWNGLFAACPRLPTLKEAQHLLVQEALRRADGKQSLAAHMLGISRQALSQRLRNHSGKKKVAQLP